MRRREAEQAVVLAARQWARLPAGSALAVMAAEKTLKERVAQLEAYNVEPVDHVFVSSRWTSTKAANWMRKYSDGLSHKVFTAIYKSWLGGGEGCTSDQLEHMLAGKHQSISPRLTELTNRGLIEASGSVRPTRSGNDAIVWTPTVMAINAAKEGGMPWSWSRSSDSPTVAS